MLLSAISRFGRYDFDILPIAKSKGILALANETSCFLRMTFEATVVCLQARIPTQIQETLRLLTKPFGNKGLLNKSAARII
jgi:hypothetical protein